MAAMIAVTGVTGRLGRRVAARLAGEPLRLLARRPGAVEPVEGAEVVTATYGDTEGCVAALTGASTLLMVSGAESADRVALHLSFVEAARQAGVAHIVYTSFLGAAPDATFTLARDHWATEEAIRATGMGWTFLRNSLYADVVPFFAGPDGAIRGPGGEGRVAPVAIDDVADVAAAVLTAPTAHAGATYELTGPEAWTLAELAAVLTEVTGRPHSYVDETIEEAYASRAPYGAPHWQVEAWVSTYGSVAEGHMALVSPDVERVTGRPPTGLREVLARLDLG